MTILTEEVGEMALPIKPELILMLPLKRIW